MYRDIVLWMILLIMGAMLLTSGVNADDSNEKEVGGWSVDYYSDSSHPNLNGVAKANVDQFYNKMVDYGWSGTGRYADEFAAEAHFEDSTRTGHDDFYKEHADLDADFVYYCGHGDPWGIWFGIDTQSIPGGVHRKANVTEIKWGDQDMEWIVLDSCEVLKIFANEQPIWYRWDNPSGFPTDGALTLHAGLHAILGWDSPSMIYNDWKSGVTSRGIYYNQSI